jgi:hypothetical protein
MFVVMRENIGPKFDICGRSGQLYICAHNVNTRQPQLIQSSSSLEPAIPLGLGNAVGRGLSSMLGALRPVAILVETIRMVWCGLSHKGLSGSTRGGLSSRASNEV